jgi:hypothetical protein
MVNPAFAPEQDLPEPERIINSTGEVIVLRFDAIPYLEEAIGSNWQEALAEVVQAGDVKQRRADGHKSNREEGFTGVLELVTARPEDLETKVPGLWDLYRGPFKDMISQVLPEGSEPLKAYEHIVDGLEGVAQIPVEQTGNPEIQHRMEAHIDGRYTAVLVVDVPESSQGGDLVIANRADLNGVTAISNDATRIHHIPGTLVCFVQGRKYPHYTEEITGGRRVIFSLNYPPESETAQQAAEFRQNTYGLQNPDQV